MHIGTLDADWLQTTGIPMVDPRQVKCPSEILERHGMRGICFFIQTLSAMRISEVSNDKRYPLLWGKE